MNGPLTSDGRPSMIPQGLDTLTAALDGLIDEVIMLEQRLSGILILENEVRADPIAAPTPARSALAEIIFSECQRVEQTVLRLQALRRAVDL